MCSELFRIPYSFHGIPIFGFGVLLVIWIVVGLGSLAATVRRYGWGGEAWSLVPLLVATLAAIFGLPKLFPAGLPIRGYGTMVVLGAAAGVAMATYRARRVGLDAEIIWSLALWLFVGGIVGARLFYVIEYWDQRFRSDSLSETLLKILDFPEGGLVIYGGLFGAALAAWFFLRKHHLPVLATADLIAPSLMIGLALGRIGCLLNGCCYGGPSTLPWAVTFPPNSPPYQAQFSNGGLYGIHFVDGSQNGPVVGRVDAGSPAAKAGVAAGDVVARINEYPITRADEADSLLIQMAVIGQPAALQLQSGRTIQLPVVTAPARSRPVHPTQIYSAINAGLLSWFLWAYYPWRRRDGEVFALLLSIYPISRFLLESIRTDESAVFGTSLSISQNISVAVLVGVIVFWGYLIRKPVGVAWPLKNSAAATK
jgi:phosphatidylglycerol---prolipoprotein diacylglyceryl transferase